ncbi:MAG TPA: ABC transporter permease [Thermoanaerobaculia bacterium]|nr:ABC transporter permease [Thermoanaerobaculia bacterium]
MLKSDLKFAARQLFRHPGYALTIIVTLALAIGANTAIFSLVNALMLRDLPYQHPEKLATIYARTTGSTPSDQRSAVDGEKWELLRDNAPSLISAVSGGASGVNLSSGSSKGSSRGSRVQYVRDERVSAHYFDVLGIRPLLGRNFSEDEDRPNGPKAVVLSDRIWRDVLGADRHSIGKAILVRGESYTIVGVLPPHTTTPSDAEIYTSLQPSRQGEGGGSNFDAIVRLRDGATWQGATAEVNRAWAIRKERYEQANPGSKLTYYLAPLQKAASDSVRPQVEALMFASGLILLIACANLAALAIVRIMARSAEIATRRALGASAWQMHKQFWIESLVLASAGAAVAVGVAFAAMRGLLLLLPEGLLPVATVPIDGRVLAFTMAVALLTSVLFGMLPAFAVPMSELRSAGRSTGGRTSLKLRQVLIAGEVALTVILLSASGLLIRTLIHLETLPPGFNPNGVLVAKVSLDDVRYHDAEAFRGLLRESLAAMRRIPGVQNAAAGLTVPYERAMNDSMTFDGDKQAATDVLYATPGYFETLEMPLLAGRTFKAADGPNAEHVAIVNRAFAEKFYGGANPVGRIINRDTRIVGEVSDVVISSRLTPVAPLQTEETVYFPAAQMPAKGLELAHTWMQPDWIVRTSGPVSGLREEMQRALASADASLPVTGFYTMNDLMKDTLATQRVEVALLGTMAALALILSAIGIFALVANSVAQRTREIGIRMALGSTTAQVMMRVSRSGVAASAAGLAIGLLLSAAALRVMRSVVFGIPIYDAVTIAGTVVILGVLAVLASVVPTLRIARIDPAAVLRSE